MVSWINNSIGSVLQGLAIPFENIADGLRDIFQSIGEWFESIWNKIVELNDNMNEFFGVYTDSIDPRSEKYWGNGYLETREEFINVQLPRVKEKIQRKIPYLGSALNLFETIGNITVGEPEPPEFKVRMPEKYGGGEYQVIDWTPFDNNRTLIHSFVKMIMWFFFLKYLIRTVPVMVSGG